MVEASKDKRSPSPTNSLFSNFKQKLSRKKPKVKARYVVQMDSDSDSIDTIQESKPPRAVPRSVAEVATLFPEPGSREYNYNPVDRLFHPVSPAPPPSQHADFVTCQDETDNQSDLHEDSLSKFQKFKRRATELKETAKDSAKNKYLDLKIIKDEIGRNAPHDHVRRAFRDAERPQTVHNEVKTVLEQQTRIDIALAKEPVDPKLVEERIHPQFDLERDKEMLLNNLTDDTNAEWREARRNLSKRGRLHKKGLPRDPVIEAAFDRDLLVATRRQRALGHKLSNLVNDKKQYKKNIDEASLEYEGNVTKVLDGVCTFFEHLKPLTLITILRAIIEGTTIQRITAVGSLFEIMGIMYRNDILERVYSFVCDFFIFVNSLFNKRVSDLIHRQSSPKQCLEELFNCTLPDIPETAITMISAATGFACLVGGGMINFASGKNTGFASYFKTFGDTSRVFNNTTTSIGHFKDLSVWLLSHLGFNFTQTTEVKKQIQEMSLFADLINERAEEARANPYKVYDGTINTKKLNDQALVHEKWFRDMNHDGKLRSHLPLYQRIVTGRTNVCGISKTIDRSLGLKQVPSIIWLWGSPGVGKTTAIDIIRHQLEKLEDRELAIYSRSTTEAFWSCYAQQPIVVYDDFSLDKADNADSKELMKIFSAASYGVPMGMAEDKGLFFNSRYVIIASNLDAPSNESMNLDALVRRRDTGYLVWNEAVKRHLEQDENLNSFDDWDNFLPNLNAQEYYYTTDANGAVTQASQVRMKGPVFAGKKGLKDISQKMYQKQVEKRNDFIYKLNKQQKYVKAWFGNTDSSAAPGVGTADLDPNQSSSDDDDGDDPDQPGGAAPVIDPEVPQNVFGGRNARDVTPPRDGAMAALAATAPDPNVLRAQLNPQPKKKGRKQRRTQQFQRRRHPYDPASDDDQDMVFREAEGVETEKPKIYWFWGDAGTGKTVLAKQIASQTSDKAIAVWDDRFDDPANFPELTTMIKDMADDGHPLIVSLNDDQHHQYFKWLSEQGESRSLLERTCRRVKFYHFTRNTTGIFRKVKMTPEEVLIGTFENNVTILDWDQLHSRDTGTRGPIARGTIIEEFRELLTQVFVAHYCHRALHALRCRDALEFDFSKVSLLSSPTPTDILSCLTFAQIRTFSYLTPVVGHIASALRNVAFNDIGLEGLIRQTNNVQAPIDIDKPIRATFKEGTFLVMSVAGILTVALETETKIKKVGGSFYFEKDGKNIKMLPQEIAFHKVMLGEEFQNDEVTFEPQHRGEIDFSWKFRAAINKCFAALSVIMSSTLIVLNFVEMARPQTHTMCDYNCQREVGGDIYIDYDEQLNFDDEPNFADRVEWGDIELDDDYQGDFRYIASGNRPLARSKYKCRCRTGYDCDLCMGNLPMFIDAESKVPVTVVVPPSIRTAVKVSRESGEKIKLPNLAQSESGEVQATAKKVRIKVESLVTGAKSPKQRIKVENNSEYQDVVASAVRGKDGTALAKEFLKSESYHVIKDKQWCPCFLNPGKRPAGGKQVGHHFCVQCDRYVLKLWNNTNPRTRCCYSCRGYKMPDWYFHEPCEHCKIERQGCEDQQFLDVARIARGNSIQFNGFYGLMLHSNIGVAPKHCFIHSVMYTKENHSATVIKYNDKKDLVYFYLDSNNSKKPCNQYKDIRKFVSRKGDPLPTRNPAVLIKDPTGTAWYAPVELVSETTFRAVGSDSDNDAIQIRTSGTSTFKSFMSEQGDCGSPLVMLDATSVRKILGIHVAGSKFFGFESHLIQEEIPERVVRQSGLFVEMIKRNVDLFYGEDPQEWCPILFPDGAPRNSSHNRCAKCNDYVLELSDRSGSWKNCCHDCVGVECPTFYKHKRRNCTLCKDFKSEPCEYAALPTHQILPTDGEIGTFTVVGRTVNHLGNPTSKMLPGKTRLRKSPFRTDMYGEPFEPAIMSKEDPRSHGEDPYLKNVDKWDRERPVQDLNELKGLCQEMGHWYAHEFKKAKLPISKLTIEEAINRDTRHVKSNPIFMHSSSGYPWSTMPRVKHKAPMFVFREKLGRYQIDRDCYEGALLGEHVEFLLKNCKKGVKTACVFDVNLKDEALPAHKIEQVKTRSIVGSPLDFTIVNRMYLHTSAASIMEIAPISPMKVGIAPNTVEWHDLYKWLTKYSQYGFDGDYRHWDASVTAEEIEATAEFHNTIYRECDPNWKEEDDVVRTTLYQILAKPLITRGGLVVQATGGVISGQPMTSTDNSSINVLKIWRGWREYVKTNSLAAHLLSFQSFLNEVSTACAGDDNCVLPKPEYKSFNFTFLQPYFASIGAEYTPARKITAGKSEFSHITEMTFLKRHFQFFDDTNPYCVGGLTDDAFCKMTSNARVIRSCPYQNCSQNVDYDVNTIAQTVETYLVEASLRGPSFYQTAKDHAVQVALEYGIDVPYPPKWKNQFTAVYHHFKHLYIDVFM